MVALYARKPGHCQQVRRKALVHVRHACSNPFDEGLDGGVCGRFIMEAPLPLVAQAIAARKSVMRNRIPKQPGPAKLADPGCYLHMVAVTLNWLVEAQWPRNSGYRGSSLSLRVTSLPNCTPDSVPRLCVYSAHCVPRPPGAHDRGRIHQQSSFLSSFRGHTALVPDPPGIWNKQSCHVPTCVFHTLGR
jgi:hypothetical protein